MASPRLQVVPDQPANASPILKWAGGKRWFVEEYGDDMFEHVLTQGGWYYEPFFGGGAMGLYLGLRNMYLSDVEPELVNLYRVVRDHTDELITMLRLLVECGTTEEMFYRVRATDPKTITDIEAAARPVYLNKLGYNGLFRQNKAGEFNVPYGKDPNRVVYDEDTIRSAARALTGTRIHKTDFERSVRTAKDGDTLYVDPPYHGTGVGYTSKGFGDADHARLALNLKLAVDRGASFFAHNADTDMVRQWYEGWTTEIISMPEKRRINSKGDGRGSTPCVLIVGGM